MTSLDAAARRRSPITTSRRTTTSWPTRRFSPAPISTTTEFTVGGITHYWTYLGNAEWDGAKVAAGLTPLIEEHVRFWGELPFRKYAFLNIVTGGGGGSGVEHLNSVAITDERRTSRRRRGAVPERGVHQPRVLPRDEREAAAAGGARAVRLRDAAGDDRPLGCAKA